MRGGAAEGPAGGRGEGREARGEGGAGLTLPSCLGPPPEALPSRLWFAEPLRMPGLQEEGEGEERPRSHA